MTHASYKLSLSKYLRKILKEVHEGDLGASVAHKLAVNVFVHDLSSVTWL